jgi:hypothetical protein
MNYYLDTEFDGPDGQLLSLGLIREDGASMYATMRLAKPVLDPWVRNNVMPFLYHIPSTHIDYKLIDVKRSTLQNALEGFLSLDKDGLPNIVSDWPSDIVHFCSLLMPAPGQMLDIRAISFLIARVDAYPTTLIGAVQHNAYWDAMALWNHFRPEDNDNERLT